MEGGSTSPDPRLERVRARLKELGYLRGPLSGLEGWILAGSGGPSSFLRVNALASLRVALVGGPLIGVPAAAAVAFINRPNITGPRDLLALCLYLSVALGLSLGLLEFLTDTSLAWLGRRGLVLVGGAERLAARVGLLFFVGTTLYLAVLVRGGRAAQQSLQGPSRGEGLTAWLLWLAAIGGALAVGHVIGRLTRLGTLLTLAAAGSDRMGDLRGVGRSPVLMASLALAAAVCLLVFAPTGPPEDDVSLGASALALPRTPTKGRTIFLGLDGLDAAEFDRQRSLGRLRELGRLESTGARYDLEASEPLPPPAAWTTIATGKPISEHGIVGYRTDRLPGLTMPIQEDPRGRGLSLSLRLLLPPLRPDPAPVSSRLRRARSVWEILPLGGATAAAVNWWATWPAVPLSDAEGGKADALLLVSERAFARLAAGHAPDRDATPDWLQQDLAARLGSDLEATRSALARLGLTPSMGPTWMAASIDRYHAIVTRRIIESRQPQLALVYLPGLDIVRSRSDGPGRSGEDARAREAELAAVIDNLDEIVRDLAAAAAGPDDLLLVAGDPGRKGVSPGLLIVSGERVLAGRLSRRPARTDLAPTLLCLAGFPTARDLPGSPVLEFLKVGDVAARLPHPIDSYGTRPIEPVDTSEDPFGGEVLERLKSLGYIN